jgi:hypothetical protein
MLSRSRSRLAVLALAIAVGVVWLFTRGGETARARAPIDRMAQALAFDERREDAAARAERIARELDASTTLDVTASIPEAPGVLRGRPALAALAGDATELHRFDLELSDVMPSFDAGGQTVLFTMRVMVTALVRGYEHREVRNASVQLVRQGEAWVISSLTVAPRTYEEPEARP